MEFLLASAIGGLTTAGVYLLLRARTFSVVLGLALLSYATNVFLFAMGRLVTNAPPVISTLATDYTDPLPQALVLTAIVISFGMTAVVVVMALRSYLESDSDHIDGNGLAQAGEPGSVVLPVEVSEGGR
ncbi:Na+/H+ antiporter subunit C [Azoarcus sp. L1K30]|uniref:Na+/H+ antiporter subunit C n=1 Tax=Azoarcus sp. L1K30 TaxID=2820277 RepID=UPI001B8184A0|nr:Na+/H+ antiporter subunit C [Azoarcus sp. L1K30]MBR0568621.1 Na+/H+ antiporter subunit C [Azoarcus sp. L1K30]